MTELTLFGKAMDWQGARDGFEGALTHGTGFVQVNVVQRVPERHGWFWIGCVCVAERYVHLPHRTGFSSPELARDDAEATLRALYDALGEVVEPWHYDDEPPASDTYEVLATRYSERIECNYWDELIVGWRASYDAPPLSDAPYAWRPMPKAPGRKEQ